MTTPPTKKSRNPTEIVGILDDRPGVPISRLSLPSAEWVAAVDDLVAGVLQLDSQTSPAKLQELRCLAEQVRDT